ncbi:MAG: FRG domain-containing protein [Candidatus Binatia bacterium]
MADPEALYGQWIGQIQGTNSGYALLNVDGDRPGKGCLQVDDPQQPFSSQVAFSIAGSTVTGSLAGFFPQDRAAQGIVLPRNGNLSGTLQGDRLTGTWQTELATQGTFELTRREPLVPRPADKAMAWGDFREWILEEYRKTRSLIFRGHADSGYPLITTFHRTGRRNLWRYVVEDVPRLCRSIEAVLGTTYDLRDPVDYGGLLNLAQHHGFPTPLLDWTGSPFVAAFFAFSALAKSAPSNDHRVRIFLFDCADWPDQAVQTIEQIRPSFVRLHLRARDNPRVLPQQSVHMFSNIVAIENFVATIEQERGRRFLRRIDLPAAERPTAMRELETMGVTAASLLPGLDGLCRTLAEKWF